ncbi:MAG: cobalamin-binding protein [Pedosphaera sp. Tous-C6FEB]|nr:MAG: cobalamin-binding protein [Pedosphaera sp. Tous-C6FEB]
MSHRRVVSLLPSATEIVCALGCSGQLIGRSHECDYPAAITSLPACTESFLPATGTSREIDDQIKQLRRTGLALYQLNTRLLQELRPDVILTQAQCEVCALSEADVAQALGGWTGPLPQIVSLTPHRLTDVWEDIRRVAAFLNVVDTGRDVLRALKTRCVDVIEKTCQLSRPTVACLEWIDPLMGAGNWVPELVELAGGKNLLGETGKHTGYLKWEQLQAANPDVIIALPCGFDLRRTQSELPALTKLPGWGDLKAVRTGRVFIADGNAGFNRPGPRLVESLESLAEILHPRKFSFGHRNRYWAPAAL